MSLKAAKANIYLLCIELCGSLTVNDQIFGHKIHLPIL